MFYDDVRTAANPDEALMEFLQSTYEAGREPRELGPRRLERSRSGQRLPGSTGQNCQFVESCESLELEPHPN